MKDKLIAIKDDLWHRFNSLDDTYKAAILGFIAGIGAIIILQWIF